MPPCRWGAQPILFVRAKEENRGPMSLPTSPLCRALMLLLGLCVSPAIATEPIRLVSEFALNADGSEIVFAWAGDIWRAPTTGGNATQLTQHPGNDRHPCF